MATAAEHYDDLLAEHYTWMLGGDLHAAAERQAGLLEGLGVRPAGDGAPAVDLGCGPGPQSLALFRLGFSPVVAVDGSEQLLAELAEHARAAGADGAIRVRHGDIRTALPGAAAPGTAAAVVCMGDTLPHLPARADVVDLLREAARALRPGGHFVATYRDLTGALHGPDRFLPVRATDDRLLTCFLEYTDEETVLVHDLLHTRTPDGWRMRASSYPKLRLAHAWVAAQCRAAGLDVLRDEAGERGMRVLHAVRP
ncbi:class I SAM-dependent methyltransferase [Streptomyces capparidis]